MGVVILSVEARLAAVELYLVTELAFKKLTPTGVDHMARQCDSHRDT